MRIRPAAAVLMLPLLAACSAVGSAHAPVVTSVTAPPNGRSAGPASAGPASAGPASGRPSTHATSRPASPASGSRPTLSSAPAPSRIPAPAKTVSGSGAVTSSSLVGERLRGSGILDTVRKAMPAARFQTVGDVVAIGDVPAASLRRIAGDGTTAVQSIAALTGESPEAQTIVLAPRSPTEFGQLVGSRQSSDVEGITETSNVWLPYVVVNAAHLTGDHLMLEHVVDHEVFHAVTLAGGIGGDQPLWLIEGFAEWAGQHISGDVLRPDTRTARLPTDSVLTGPDAPEGYQLATSFVRYLVGTYGRSTAVRFYLDAVEADPGSLDPLAQRHFHRTMAQLTRAWQAAYDSGELAHQAP